MTYNADLFGKRAKSPYFTKEDFEEHLMDHH